MYTTAKPLFFRTETPLHAGTGSDLGHIDLPIQREKHTSFPNIQSSSLKGAFRENIENNVTTLEERIGVHLTFGYDSDGVKNDVKQFFDTPEGQTFSGALAFTDARLILFPIKSYKGIYCLATCPLILEKFAREVKNVCTPNLQISIPSFDLGKEKVAVAKPNFLSIEGNVYLEEYSFEVKATEKEKAIQLAQILQSYVGDDVLDRLVIMPNEVFRDFTKLSTEVITRTKIQNDTGTVESGALFTEEYLPTESYMYTIVAAHRIFQTKSGKEKREKDEFKNINIISESDVINFFKNKISSVAQIGGSSTIGKGIVKLFKSHI